MVWRLGFPPFFMEALQSLRQCFFGAQIMRLSSPPRRGEASRVKRLDMHLGAVHLVAMHLAHLAGGPGAAGLGPAGLGLGREEGG